MAAPHGYVEVAGEGEWAEARAPIEAEGEALQVLVAKVPVG